MTTDKQPELFASVSILVEISLVFASVVTFICQSILNRRKDRVTRFTVIHIPILNFEYDVCRYLECPHLHQLNRLTVDAYQKIAKIADHQASLKLWLERVLLLE